MLLDTSAFGINVSFEPEIDKIKLVPRIESQVGKFEISLHRISSLNIEIAGKIFPLSSKARGYEKLPHLKRTKKKIFQTKPLPLDPLRNEDPGGMVQARGIVYRRLSSVNVCSTDGSSLTSSRDGQSL